MCFRHIFLCHIFSFQDLFHNKGYFGAFDEEKWGYESESKYQRLLHLVQVHQPYPNMCLPMQVRFIQFLSTANQNQKLDDNKILLVNYITNGTMRFKMIEITTVTGIFAKVIRDYWYPYSGNNQTSACKNYSAVQ